MLQIIHIFFSRRKGKISEWLRRLSIMSCKSSTSSCIFCDTRDSPSPMFQSYLCLILNIPNRDLFKICINRSNGLSTGIDQKGRKSRYAIRPELDGNEIIRVYRIYVAFKLSIIYIYIIFTFLNHIIYIWNVYTYLILHTSVKLS